MSLLESDTKTRPAPRPQRRGTHQQSKTAVYRIWGKMKRRCCSPDDPGYPNYGDRGITVCARWLESVENFIADMGPRPTIEHSLDRIDNDGNYEPSNCRWATKVEQAANRRVTLFETIDGVTKPVSEWARVYGVKLVTVHWRHARGVTGAALFAPPNRRRWWPGAKGRGPSDKRLAAEAKRKDETNG